MKTILLIGKNGQVGWELERALPAVGSVIALDRGQLDLTQPDAIRKVIRDLSPDIIVNAAGYTAVDKAEVEAELAMQINATAPGIMAEEAKRINALLVHYSTDYVFDGTSAAPYVEDDTPNPVNVYGKSKLEGERAIAAVGCAHLILRTSWIYSPRSTNFVLTMLRLARERKEIAVVDDQIGSPTSARELAKTTTELLEKFRGANEHIGVFHLSASGYTSRFDLAKEIVKIAAGFPGEWAVHATVRAATTENYPLPAARPLNASTSKEKIKRIFGIEMLAWEYQIQTSLKELLAVSTSLPTTLAK